MTFRYFNRVRGSGAARAFDSDALAWETAVAANGGSVSLNQRILVDQLIYSLKSAGCWSLMDDAWLLVAENPQQALTSLKQKRFAMAVNSPVFAANQGYAFDGATNYIETSFNCSTMAIAMTGTSARVSVYERVNVNFNNAVLGISQTVNRNFELRPRSATNMSAAVLSTITTLTGVITNSDSRGMVSTSVTGGATWESFKNGASLGTYAPTGTASTLPTTTLWIGGANSSGTLVRPRATTLGWASLGAALSAGQELAEYNAIQAYMTAKGANV